MFRTPWFAPSSPSRSLFCLSIIDVAQVAVAGVMFGFLVDDTATVVKLFQVVVLAVVLNIAFFGADHAGH